MKQITGILAALVIGLLSASPALAREGNIQLSNSDVACEGVSIWRESAYKVTGRCQGLVYPYETLYDHYVIWAKLDNGNIVRIDDVERGYFEGNVSESFKTISITAEGVGTPRRPSTKEVVAGDIQAFAFDKSETTAPAPAATPVPQTNGITVQNNVPVQTGSTVGSVIGRILRALLIIVGVIIAVAVVASLLFRRRGSVSA